MVSGLIATPRKECLPQGQRSPSLGSRICRRNLHNVTMTDLLTTDTSLDQAASWVTGPWLAFDTETTGVSPKTDRLVTAACVMRPQGALGGIDVTTNWLADPGVPIPAAASQIHGVTTEHARAHGASIAQVLDEVNEMLASHMSQGNVVVIFNAAYDLPLIEAESLRHGVTPLSSRLGGRIAPVVDPLVIDRAVERYRKGKKTLSLMAEAYGLDLPQDTHQAHVDCSLTLDVLAAIVCKHQEPRSVEVTDLDRYHREKHGEWAKDFESFLANRGRQTHISRTWF